MTAGRTRPRLSVFAAWMAVGVCLSAAAMSWLGYRSVREWQRGADQLMAHRQADAADQLVATVARDMRGAQTAVLSLADWSVTMMMGDDDVTLLAAGAFARYPYPESFFRWRGRPGSDSITFFNRADRAPAWDGHAAHPGRFPVVIEKDPAVAGRIGRLLRSPATTADGVSVFETSLNGITYQVIARLFYSDPFHERLAGGFGFLVNLSWVRSTYFPELLRQVRDIGEGEGFALAILDDRHEAVARARGSGRDGRIATRTFPLLFCDPLLLTAYRPPDLPRHDWTVQVELATPATLVQPYLSANQLLLAAAIAAGSLGLGLALTTHAVFASAELANLRSDFVASVTHELKTPLATIRAAGDAVASGRVSGADALGEYAQLVVQEAKRLTRLIDNLLAYARITDVTEVYSFESLSVEWLVDDALRKFATRLSIGGFTVAVDIPEDLPNVFADRTAISLLLDNLIDNAIRYSNSVRSLTVRAWPGQMITISVADAGIGIPRDELPRVARKFFRGKEAGSAGSGLGLAIVSRIVKDHGGTLAIDSIEGRGTTVRLTLPRVDRDDKNRGAQAFARYFSLDTLRR